MPDEQEVSAGFPTAGLDVTCEFGRQPVDTTPDNQNVRSYEPAAGKNRGGSRAGLTRYVDEQVVGTNLIQHLCVLVDPQQPGLRADVDPEFTDPSTNNLRVRVPPGRRIRLGGSAISPYGNDEEAASGSPIAFVQKKHEQPGNFAGTYDLTLDSQPGMNHVVVVCVRTETTTGASELVESVTNGDGDAFSQAGGDGYTSDVSFSGPTSTQSLSVFYRVCQGTPADAIVRVTRGSPQFAIYEVTALEYREQAQGGPISNTTRVSVSPPGVSSMPFGSLAMNNTAGQACVAFLTSANTGFELSPDTEDAPYTVRYGVRVGGVDADPANTVTIDRVGINGATPENPIVTTFGGDDRGYCAIMIALTK